MNEKPTAGELAAGWIEAWKRMDIAWLRQRLALDFVHVSPFGRLEGRDLYLATVEPMARGSVRQLRVKEVIASGDQAAVWFENHTDAGAVPSCDWIRVENGRIREIRSFYDPSKVREVLSASEQADLGGARESAAAKGASKRPWPIIAVADVVRSSNWYATLLDARQNHPGATVFNQILDGDGTVLLCLHHWGPSGPRGDHDWPSLASPGNRVGNGVLLWFVVSDFDATWARAQTSGAAIDESPNTDNGTGLRAFVVHDLDGYYVAINEAREGAA